MEYHRRLDIDDYAVFCGYYHKLLRRHVTLPNDAITNHVTLPNDIITNHVTLPNDVITNGQNGMTTEEAAVKIQSTYKGFKVRRELNGIKDTSEEIPKTDEKDINNNEDDDDFAGYTEEEAAAIAIQAQFRGHQTRKQLKLKAAGKEAN